MDVTRHLYPLKNIFVETCIIFNFLWSLYLFNFSSISHFIFMSISLHIYSYCSQSCMTIQSLYMQSVEYKQLISSFEEDYSQNNYILHGSVHVLKSRCVDVLLCMSSGCGNHGISGWHNKITKWTPLIIRKHLDLKVFSGNKCYAVILSRFRFQQ